MSSTLRLSIIMVLVLATAALGLIAYIMNLPKPVQVTENTPAPPTVGYFVAARPLPKGTLAHEEDFAVRSVPSDSVPTGAILDTPDAKIGLRGSLVRRFLDTGSPVTSQDLSHPGFLASALAPDSRAISIKVDAESSVSGLIRLGDYVDVVSTQVIEKADLAQKADKADLAHGALSETVVHNVRILAIQDGSANKERTVSLQLAPEQVRKIAAAEQLGKLSLVVRSALDQQDTEATDTTVVVYAGNKVTKYSVKKHDTGNTRTVLSSDVSPGAARQSATVVGHAGDKVNEYPVRLPEKQ
jgi:pilus assembly protein CpaB